MSADETTPETFDLAEPEPAPAAPPRRAASVARAETVTPARPPSLPYARPVPRVPTPATDGGPGDVVLPWQYTLLAIGWIVGLLAGGLLALTFARGMFPAEVRPQIRVPAIGYLVAMIGVTPLLIVGGRRQVRAWREAAPRGVGTSALGVVTPRARSTAGLSLVAVPVLVVVVLITLRGTHGGAVTGAIIGGAVGGLLGLVRKLMRDA